MQQRMSKFQMDKKSIDILLKKADIAHIGTVAKDGSPYVLPVNYVYYKGNVYLHGLNNGTKLENIKRDSRVCLAVTKFNGILKDNLSTPCDTDANYESVVIKGTAKILEDFQEKKEMLTAFSEKYTPEYKDTPLPAEKVNGTAVIKITPQEITGKYHK